MIQSLIPKKYATTFVHKNGDGEGRIKTVIHKRSATYQRLRDHEKEVKDALKGLALYKPQRITVTKKMMHCGEKSRCSPLFQIRIAALLRALQALSAAAAINLTKSLNCMNILVPRPFSKKIEGPGNMKTGCPRFWVIKSVHALKVSYFR